jgi:hypothetical protein
MLYEQEFFQGTIPPQIFSFCLQNILFSKSLQKSSSSNPPPHNQIRHFPARSLLCQSRPAISFLGKNCPWVDCQTQGQSSVSLYVLQTWICFIHHGRASGSQRAYPQDLSPPRVITVQVYQRQRLPASNIGILIFCFLAVSIALSYPASA